MKQIEWFVLLLHKLFQLIKKITGFGPEERNFEICRDFFVSNLLYHNCLEPHERDINKRLQGIAEKWLINADRPR